MKITDESEFWKRALLPVTLTVIFAYLIMMIIWNGILIASLLIIETFTAKK